MFETFRTRAEAVSAKVHRFERRPEALAFIVSLLAEEGVAGAAGPHAVWASSPFLEGVDRARLARDVPVRFDVTRELASTARVGVSQMDFAIAGTGTLVQACAAVEQRLASMLPEVHVAILPTRAIVPDLPALFAAVRPEDAGYLAFVTGPSRTADIERVLTIGVHGPERLHVVCVDDL